MALVVVELNICQVKNNNGINTIYCAGHLKKFRHQRIIIYVYTNT